MTQTTTLPDVTIIREFAPVDRYPYDFRVCTIARGWAQIDTGQDASYYGQWINPAKREIFAYCEGDRILTRCKTDAALCAEIARMKAWNLENGRPLLRD